MIIRDYKYIEIQYTRIIISKFVYQGSIWHVVSREVVSLQVCLETDVLSDEFLFQKSKKEI